LSQNGQPTEQNSVSELTRPNNAYLPNFKIKELINLMNNDSENIREIRDETNQISDKSEIRQIRDQTNQRSDKSEIRQIRDQTNQRSKSSPYSASIEPAGA